MGLAGKRVILKQWYWAPVDADGAEVDAADADHYEWKQNKKFGNDLYTQAEHGSDAAADEGMATDTLATIPGSTWDVTEGGIWVLTSDGKTVTDNGDGTTTETVDAAKVGQYLFDKLPTRYVRAHKGNELGTEYLAGYTVEVLGNVNGASAKQPDQRAQAVTGLPATLVQQRTDADTRDDDVLNSQALSQTVSATVDKNGDANGNYRLVWGEQTEQSAYGEAAEGGTLPFTKHTMEGKIVLAGVAEANSPAASTVTATTSDNAAEPGKAVAFDWNIGRDELNLDGGFGAYETGKITGTVFQDKNVDGFYSEKDVNAKETGDKPVAGETLQLSQWFFVPAGDTLASEVDLGKEVELGDGTKVTKTRDTAVALKAAGFEFDDTASDDGIWFKSKTFSYRTNVADLPLVDVKGDDGTVTQQPATLDPRVAVDASGWFEGTVSGFNPYAADPAQSAGDYLFEELTSYVYVDMLTQGEGDI